jgi:hypothetical protein
MTQREFWELFHREWGKAKGDGDRPRADNSPDYDKQAWVKMQAHVERLEKPQEAMTTDEELAESERVVRSHGHPKDGLDAFDSAEFKAFAERWLGFTPDRSDGAPLVGIREIDVHLDVGSLPTFKVSYIGYPKQ